MKILVQQDVSFLRKLLKSQMKYEKENGMYGFSFFGYEGYLDFLSPYERRLELRERDEYEKGRYASIPNSLLEVIINQESYLEDFEKSSKLDYCKNAAEYAYSHYPWEEIFKASRGNIIVANVEMVGEALCDIDIKYEYKDARIKETKDISLKNIRIAESGSRDARDLGEDALIVSLYPVFGNDDFGQMAIPYIKAMLPEILYCPGYASESVKQTGNNVFADFIHKLGQRFNCEETLIDKVQSDFLKACEFHSSVDEINKEIEIMNYRYFQPRGTKWERDARKIGGLFPSWKENVLLAEMYKSAAKNK